MTPTTTPSDAEVEAFCKEFDRWCTGFNSKERPLFRHSVLCEDVKGFDIISLHGEREAADRTMVRRRSMAALTAAYALRAQTEEQIRQDERDWLPLISAPKDGNIIWIWWENKRQEQTASEFVWGQDENNGQYGWKFRGSSWLCSNIKMLGWLPFIAPKISAVRARSTVQPSDQNTPDPEILKAAEDALKRMEACKDEPVEVWADRLASQFAELGSDNAQPGASTEVPGSPHIYRAVRAAAEKVHLPILEQVAREYAAKTTASPSDQGQAGVDARSVLRELEWSAGGNVFCPVCGGFDPKQEMSELFPQGHTPGCRLAAAIEGTGPYRVKDLEEQLRFVEGLASVAINSCDDAIKQRIAAESALAAERARVGK